MKTAHSDISPSARTAPNPLAEQFDSTEADVLALVVLWSAREPFRVGEVALLPAEYPVWLFGRDPEQPITESIQHTNTTNNFTNSKKIHPSSNNPASRAQGVVRFVRQRPEGVSSGDPPRALAGESISRLQLHMSHREEGLFTQNVGRCALLVNGQPT